MLSVSQVMVPVSDPDISIEFFTGKLGFEVFSDRTFGKQRWVSLTVPDSQVRVALTTLPTMIHQRGGPSTIVFTAKDVDATYADLVARGVEFTLPLTKKPWSTTASFKDPDGNTFILSNEA